MILLGIPSRCPIITAPGRADGLVLIDCPCLYQVPLGSLRVNVLAAIPHYHSLASHPLASHPYPLTPMPYHSSITLEVVPEDEGSSVVPSGDCSSIMLVGKGLCIYYPFRERANRAIVGKDSQDDDFYPFYDKSLSFGSPLDKGVILSPFPPSPSSPLGLTRG